MRLKYSAILLIIILSSSMVNAQDDDDPFADIDRTQIGISEGILLEYVITDLVEISPDDEENTASGTNFPEIGEIWVTIEILEIDEDIGEVITNTVPHQNLLDEFEDNDEEFNATSVFELDDFEGPFIYTDWVFWKNYLAEQSIDGEYASDGGSNSVDIIDDTNTFGLKQERTYSSENEDTTGAHSSFEVERFEIYYDKQTGIATRVIQSEKETISREGMDDGVYESSFTLDLKDTGLFPGIDSGPANPLNWNGFVFLIILLPILTMFSPKKDA